MYPKVEILKVLVYNSSVPGGGVGNNIIMVFKYKRKTERAQGWDENIMNRAINSINQRETSIRGAALKHPPKKNSDGLV
ncbi:unnamed protein product [Acanthoscelides obtectus]|uniref:Uncharacterized protein n=1 Tax=Acanthoscelides obtectus TaxID=200917 RepID=A0A9P0K705_ACAOB|nr:unnamed protein product [Acanthoscelides obtectus]CAK1662584.1 hypothetical protein AOBTE_LOCUS23224 [Acanthoscelides obtectus]